MATSTRQGTDRVGSGLLPMLGGLLIVALLAIECARDAALANAHQLLEQAEETQISGPQRFAQLIDELTRNAASLPRQQREHLEYLQACKLLYAGDYRSGLTRLQ